MSLNPRCFACLELFTDHRVTDKSSNVLIVPSGRRENTFYCYSVFGDFDKRSYLYVKNFFWFKTCTIQGSVSDKNITLNYVKPILGWFVQQGNMLYLTQADGSIYRWV